VLQVGWVKTDTAVLKVGKDGRSSAKRRLLKTDAAVLNVGW
jgi:hypothetical protein